MLKPEIKEKWVDALRSGEFKQRDKFLGPTPGCDGYCCLGVLQMVVDGEVEMEVVAGTERSGRFPARDFIEKVSLIGNTTAVSIKFTHLAERNDGGEPFLEIADYIEAYL